MHATSDTLSYDHRVFSSFRDARAVYGCQCALKDGKPIFGCCTGPYQAGACACSNEAKPAPGGPDVVSMDR